MRFYGFSINMIQYKCLLIKSLIFVYKKEYSIYLQSVQQELLTILAAKYPLMELARTCNI